MGLKLEHKLFLKGQLVVLTGLHIGGSKTTLDIGGIDSNVVKTASRYPFIPGSSLKGKLRSLLARLEGSEDVKNDSELIQSLFGRAGDDKQDKAQMTRLMVGDATLNIAAFEHMRERALDQIEEGQYTEGKMENKIDRKRGSAINPREVERVLPGTLFDFEIIYNHCKDDEEASQLGALIQSLELLADDYLGGSGTRGYGKVGFYGFTLKKRTAEDYWNGNPRQDIDTGDPDYSDVWERLHRLEDQTRKALESMPYAPVEIIAP